MQAPIWRECRTFLIYIFLYQRRKQCLEFALPKPGEICKHLAGAYNSTVIPVGFCCLTFLCENKQRNQYNGVNLLRKFVSEKLTLLTPYPSTLRGSASFSYLVPYHRPVCRFASGHTGVFHKNFL